MKALLTGGAGFIGSVVQERLEAVGADVVVFDRAGDLEMTSPTSTGSGRHRPTAR